MVPETGPRDPVIAQVMRWASAGVTAQEVSDNDARRNESGHGPIAHPVNLGALPPAAR